MCYMHCQSHPPSLDHPNYIWNCTAQSDKSQHDDVCLPCSWYNLFIDGCPDLMLVAFSLNIPRITTAVFWVVMPYSSVEVHRLFAITSLLHLDVETVCSSEMAADFPPQWEPYVYIQRYSTHASHNTDLCCSCSSAHLAHTKDILHMQSSVESESCWRIQRKKGIYPSFPSEL
jgi:hypothetical protein